jgi:hypothetical protein
MPWPLDSSPCFRVFIRIFLPFFFHACCMFYSFPPSLNDPEGRAVAQAVSHRALIPCSACGGQSSTGTIFSPGFRLSPASIIPPKFHKHSSIADAMYSYKLTASLNNTHNPPNNESYKIGLVQFVIIFYCQRK